MRRAQLSIDLLFAVTLVSLTVVGLIGLSTQEIEGTKTFDAITQLKVFSVDLRDTVSKVYSVGDGFSIRKDAPFPLGPGENLTVTLNSTSNRMEIVAVIDGRTYKTEQQLQVPIISNSSVTLNSTIKSLWVVAKYNETLGMVDVKVQTSP